MAILVIGGCSVESMDEFSTLDSKAKSKSTETSNEDPMGFYTGQNNGRKLQGTLSITNDCDNLYLEIIPEGDAPGEVDIWILTELPELNGGGNNIPGGSQYDLDDADGLTWSFALSEFDTEQEILIFTKAWGSFAGPQLIQDVSYTEYSFDLSMCVCEESFEYTENENGTYSFTYTPEDDMIAAEIVFTFAQAVEVDGFSDDWSWHGQTMQSTMNLFACTPVTWILNLTKKCDGSTPNNNVWTDFKVNDISKKGELDNIVQTCQ